MISTCYKDFITKTRVLGSRKKSWGTPATPRTHARTPRQPPMAGGRAKPGGAKRRWPRSRVEVEVEQGRVG